MVSLQYVLAYVSLGNCPEIIPLHTPSRYLAFLQNVFVYVSLGHPSEKLLPTLFTSIGLLFSMCSYICVQSSSLTKYGSTLAVNSKCHVRTYALKYQSVDQSTRMKSQTPNLARPKQQPHLKTGR